MFAINDYAVITNATTFIMEVYQLWLIARNEEIFTGSQKEVLDCAKSLFPSISSLSLNEQKRLALEKLNDDELKRTAP